MPGLYYCVERGDFVRLRDLLNQGGNPNILDDNGDTPLHVAAFKVLEDPEACQDNIEVARLLIQFGANVDHMNNLGNTPLHFAAARRNYKMIEILLEAKAQINLQDDDGNTGLHYAINNCALLKRVDPQYVCPIGHSCSDWRTVEQFLKFYRDISIADDFERYLDIHMDNDLENSLDINLANNLEETPLMWAVEAGNFCIVHELLEKRASPNRRDLNGNTALHFAIDQPVVDFDIVVELLRHGSYPYMRNTGFKSPVDVYLYRLLGAPITEKGKAFYIFKLFLIKRNLLTKTQVALITKNDLNDIFFLRTEIFAMLTDKVTPRYSVYGIISRVYGANSYIPFEHCDKVLAKLLTGKYRFYSDIIASCFPRTYLSHKFSEICCWEEKNNVRKEFLNYDLRFWLSFIYLSPYDTYKMMLAGKES